MSDVLWENYGLRKNPYDTIPLTEGGDLLLEKAFIGRNIELKTLNSLTHSENRFCLTICGKVGVGKTSLANFYKFLWKNKSDSKSLFSFRREIEANLEMLNKKHFILEIMASFLREVKLIDSKFFQKHKVLQEIEKLVNFSETISLTGGLSIAGFGVEAGQEKNFNLPLQITYTQLEDYLTKLLNLICKEKINNKHHSGLIVHMNNFDVVMQDNPQKIVRFFQEIRDILQIPHLYFVFIGPENFFKDIISKEARVKSIFYSIPILLSPLNKKELVQAFDERLELLKSPQVENYIRPVSTEVIYALYDLYEGDIRSIMTAIHEIIKTHGDKTSRTLQKQEALALLGKYKLEELEMLKITEDQKQILYYLFGLDSPFKQSDIAKKFKKEPNNISGYYFKPFINKGIIELHKKMGREKYWKITKNFQAVKYMLEFQKQLQTNSNLSQLSLFKQ